MRTNEFLKQRLNQIWGLLFEDMPKLNSVTIRFKGLWKNKFGHIKKYGRDTEIAINGFFKNEIVPEYIIDLTIAHELIHYSHGFNSPLEKKFKHPHKGGIVTKELKNRGFSNILKKEKLFVKKEWPMLYKTFKNQ